MVNIRKLVTIVEEILTDGGRPHPRIGGLTKDEAKKEDGLR